MSVDARGPHEGGGRAHPQGAHRAPSWPPRLFLDFHSIPLDHVCSKKIASEGFIPFGLRLIFFSFETLK